MSIWVLGGSHIGRHSRFTNGTGSPDYQSGQGWCQRGQCKTLGIQVPSQNVIGDTVMVPSERVLGSLGGIYSSPMECLG